MAAATDSGSVFDEREEVLSWVQDGTRGTPRTCLICGRPWSDEDDEHHRGCSP